LIQRLRADDLLCYEDDLAVFQFRLRKAVDSQSVHSKNRTELRQPRKSDVIVGAGVWHKQLFDRIEAVAATDVAIAIFGESGTGKELVARTIHRSSPRRDAPFVVVNCAAIPGALLEDELFGHVRGAFTDASKDREGLIAAAAGGTLFLDEIGELPLPLQAKLLRFLQSHEIRRIGDNIDRHIDVRIVTATNRDLERAVANGEFREDLYYRIAVFSVQLPPLRHRPDDIPLLAHHIIGLLTQRIGRNIAGITPQALAALQRYPFPGNVRELENKLHHAMVVARDPWIAIEDLGLPTPQVATRPIVIDDSHPFRQAKLRAIAEFEKHYVTQLMAAHRGVMTAAANAAGLDRKQLWILLQKAGLSRRDFK
jgi:DNA-binding NtrC family response regulator